MTSAPAHCSIDVRLRAVALLTPYLWDNYTIAWRQGST